MSYFQTKDILELSGSVSANLSMLSSGHNFSLSCLYVKRCALCYLAGGPHPPFFLQFYHFMINPGLQEMFPVWRHNWCIILALNTDFLPDLFTWQLAAKSKVLQVGSQEGLGKWHQIKQLSQIKLVGSKQLKIIFFPSAILLFFQDLPKSILWPHYSILADL